MMTEQMQLAFRGSCWPDNRGHRDFRLWRACVKAVSSPPLARSFMSVRVCVSVGEGRGFVVV